MKLEKLNKEQEELMYKTRDEWINHFYSLKEIDEKEFENGINWLYTDLLKKEKPKVVYCDSWISYLITISILQEMNNKNIKLAPVRDSVEASVWDSVWDSVSASVRASVSDSVWSSVEASVWTSVEASVRDSVSASVRDSVGDSVRDSVRGSVSASVWDSVEASVWDSVWDSVGDSVWNSVWTSVWDSVSDSVRGSLKENFRKYSNYSNSYSNYGWVSFYDYFEKIGVLNNSKLKKYKKLIKSGAFQVYEFENIVFAIQPPTYFLRNESGQLHSLERKGYEFRDGTGHYYINGKEIKEEYFFGIKDKTLKVESFLKEENEEQKSACIEMMQLLYGDEYLVNFLGDVFKEKDTFVDKKDDRYLEGTTNGMNVGVYTLFEGYINNGLVKYVRCYCPSTDRMFFLGVDNSVTNAKDAIASLYRVPRKLKNNITHISRQGERYSTIFDVETTNKLKNKEISSKDLEDLVSLDGDTYFDLIKYEF